MATFSDERINNNDDAWINDERDFPHCHEGLWQVLLEQLTEFQETHGHLNVPLKMPDPFHLLPLWIVCQRERFRHKYTGKYWALSDSKEKLLDSIGFMWGEENLELRRIFQQKQFQEQLSSIHASTLLTNTPLSLWPDIMDKVVKKHGNGRTDFDGYSILFYLAREKNGVLFQTLDPAFLQCQDGTSVNGSADSDNSAFDNKTPILTPQSTTNNPTSYAPRNHEL